MRLLLITPPFTQPNTPYPATQYLKGYLNQLNISSFQADLSLEVLLDVLSKRCLNDIFTQVEEAEIELDDNCYQIYLQKEQYFQWIDPVIHFLQGKNPTLAYQLSSKDVLPKASRFANAQLFSSAFGSPDIQDKAKYYATLFLEDIFDFIQTTIDQHFGFSRYAEHLSRAASRFDDIWHHVQHHKSLITSFLEKKIDHLLQRNNYDLVCITIPFIGNVFSAFRTGYYIKKCYPNVKVVMGGGYCNTELRNIYDERIFNCTDYITLDDGELPLQCLIEHIENGCFGPLKRTFKLVQGIVTYCNDATQKDVPQSEVGTPDYSDLNLSDYLQLMDMVNPMQRLWSDGRWNKMTLAHGCYWGKCTFCDVSLDYIGRYEPISAKVLVDRIEAIVKQTGSTGFHFVDEAAPPKLLRDVALEIIHRKLNISWWTNIRFEVKFNEDLCRLLKLSGCIAVSGGLEVASDRLLTLIQKGVTVTQVAKVCHAFQSAGIMVHAYLMYGFPTQTAQETIDSLEMVRQLMKLKLINSAFWHQFALTAHSPVGLNPELYHISIDGPEFGGFAQNDLFHTDKSCNHEEFSEGLSLSMFNYMQGKGMEIPVHQWFEFSVPKTSVRKDFIRNAINENHLDFRINDNNIVTYLGEKPIECIVDEEENHAEFIFHSSDDEIGLSVPIEVMDWVIYLFDSMDIRSGKYLLGKEFKASFQNQVQDLDFDDIVNSPFFHQFRKMGLMLI